MTAITDRVIKLYENWANEKVISLTPLDQSGSYRKYFRISGKDKNAIGVFSPDKKENKAFISLTKHFLNKGLKVPHFFSIQLKNNIYLIEDFGDTTLYSAIEKEKSKGKISERTINLYKAALSNLIQFQIDGGKGLNYSICFPQAKFDKQSILWDLNYFKYYFLKLLKIPSDEQKLEDDFNTFAEFLLSADSNYFMYRDFQSRNILIHNDELYFIDYQGGRKGALQYDVASLLFQAKVNLSEEIRQLLLKHYLTELQKHINVDIKVFKKYYYGYVLIRLLQTLGAYGFRGLYENKSHFLLSIPYALKNLQWLIENDHLPKKLKELNTALISILNNNDFMKNSFVSSSEKLKVTINSFSYKEGIPKDFSGNGGGFVFDCRSLENPGRYPEYVNNTGLDENVIDFLQNRNGVKDFLTSVYSLADEAIINYQNRNFKNLMISFGCTGGQHRSVYCAEELAKHITAKFNVQVVLNHLKIDQKGNL